MVILITGASHTVKTLFEVRQSILHWCIYSKWWADHNDWFRFLADCRRTCRTV